MANSSFNCVMIVDDSDIDCWIAELLIRKVSFAKNILVFNKAEEALDYLQNADSTEIDSLLPDLIFLDLIMLLRDGFYFLERYEATRQDEIAIYILTASTLTADRERARRFKSVKAFILKPLTEATLLNLKNQ